MLKRAANLRIVVVSIAVALLAGCTAVVSGVGTRVSTGRVPSSSSGSSGSSASSAPAQLPSLLRTKLSGPFGDLPTDDLCHGIPMRAFNRWGHAFVHPWQTAGTCYVDVLVSSTEWFQLNSWISEPGEFDPGFGRPRTIAGGARLYSQPMRKHDCERDVEIGATVFETHTKNVHGPVPSAVLCAVSTAYAGQEARAFASKTLPSRSLGHPTLTRFDLCALMAVGRVEAISVLASARRGQFLNGGGCFADGSYVEVTARVAFIAEHFGLEPANASVRGHRLLVTGDHNKSYCEVISRQGATRDGRAFEILDIQVDHVTGTPRQSYCDIAKAVAVRMLHAAALR